MVDMVSNKKLKQDIAILFCISHIYLIEVHITNIAKKKLVSVRKTIRKCLLLAYSLFVYLFLNF